MSSIVYRLRFEKIEVDDYGVPLSIQDDGFNIQAQQMISSNELRAWRETNEPLDRLVFDNLKDEVINKAWSKKV